MKRGWGVGLLLIAVFIVAAKYLSVVSIPVLQPRGPVADKEFRLMITVTLLMLIVVVPIFVLLAYILWRYRENSSLAAKYQPDWDHNRWIEGMWWVIPSALILVLSVITWKATYELNPYKPLASKIPAIPVEVIALDWKWLFIYPKQHVASVNQLVIPVNTPVHFYITSDGPMNSLWIPQLSGQIYAMAGMQTQLYIMASQLGSYRGSSANISGSGFASMVFQTKAITRGGFNNWVKQVQGSAAPLTLSRYNHLEKPSTYQPVSYYSNPANNLFYYTINQFMTPINSSTMRGGING